MSFVFFRAYDIKPSVAFFSGAASVTRNVVYLCLLWCGIVV